MGYELSLRKYGNGHGAWVAMFDRDPVTTADGFGGGRCNGGVGIGPLLS